MEQHPGNRPESVPYIVFESELARQERHAKRLWIALVTAIARIRAVVYLLTWYLRRSDDVSDDHVGEGVNIIGDMNGVDYGGPAIAYEDEEVPPVG